jgi:voltage-gated potassium channel
VESLGKPSEGWRLRLYTVIFEADTRACRLFDQWLIALILLSVAVVIIDSLQSLFHL